MKGSAMIRRSLTASMVDGAFYAIMVGLCENYFSALAVELGFSNSALALFSSVPLLIGALAQIFTPYWVGLLGSRKRLVLVAASSQALANLFFWWIASQGSASLA